MTPRSQWDSVEWYALLLTGCIALTCVLIVLALTGVIGD